MMALKNRISLPSPLFGLFCSTPSPLTVELIAAAGYDFTIIDLEHTLISPDQLAVMLMAARASGISALVRVAAPYQALQALDNGAEGIVFARIRSPAQALDAVRSCHYAPLGLRGLNSTWHSAYGRDDLVETMHAMALETLVIAMIEDLEGLEHVDAIAGVDGIDALMEGAADLSQSLGLPWQTRHPRVRAGVSAIQSAAARNGKAFCCLPRAKEDFDCAVEQQVRLFILGDDRGITRRAMNSHLVQHKPSLR
ncbi:HpcH/HpaI aldolase family protein [Herbaspirillum robiniae]|uniref:Siderophore biosynthesis protein SbnG n=1 Tax=Herbaspirillum robiniae TaxID=2014887 RepID=A0A246WRS5_9BURK|nr:aldolase/citrate lyase family protein [Herbaspirillum robiniae]OWY29125.1 siderophore biosynthesis protein SbnG [Herbaspirillum robiniae]